MELHDLLKDQYREMMDNLTDWVEMMWNYNEFDHNGWTGPDEVVASIRSYLEGKHKK